MGTGDDEVIEACHEPSRRLPRVSTFLSYASVDTMDLRHEQVVLSSPYKSLTNKWDFDHRELVVAMPS